MKKFASLWLACGLVPMVLCAQQATPPELPPGPLLNKAPEFAQWTITTKPAATPADSEPAEAESTPDRSPSPTPRHRQKSADSTGKKTAPPVERTTVVTKTQSLRHEETSAGAEPKMQKWCVPDMQVTIDGSTAPVVSLPGNAADSDYVDYSKTDFPGFEWISNRNFTGARKVLGQDCLIFEDQPVAKKKGSGEPVPSTAVAAINSATRLPVSLQTGEETQTYEFGLAPTAMLALPPDVQAVVEQWRKTMSQSALMPAKP